MPEETTAYYAARGDAIPTCVSFELRLSNGKCQLSSTPTRSTRPRSSAGWETCVRIFSPSW